MADLAELKTTTTLLDGDRARIDVEVPAEQVEHDVQHTLHHLSESVKIPGFRKGRVPARLVMQRLGREEVLTETLREHLSSWYGAAVEAARLRAFDRPSIDWETLPGEGEPFRFTATVRLRPKGTFADDLVLEVPRPEVEVKPTEIDAELERLREQASPLREVADRPAQAGDFVEIDISTHVAGKRNAQASLAGYHVQLGSGRALPEVDSALVGISVGETREATTTLPQEHADRKLAGKEATLEITLNRLQEREQLPLDDEVARATSEFETLAELRADIERAMREAQEHEIDGGYRGAVLAALGNAVRVTLPPELIEDKVDELAVGMSRGLARRGLTLARYLQMTGQSPDDLRRQLVPGADSELRAEIGLEAFADREQIEIDDAALEAALLREAEASEEDDPAAAVQELMASPAKDQAREELRLRLALDRAVERSTPITLEQAEAREKLWTPDKDAEQKTPELWTPTQR